jgi:hypothetical protein
MKLLEAISGDMIIHLVELCQDELGLPEQPPYELVTDEPYIEGGGKKSFGEFDGNKIRVVTTGRHPMDIMRTLAHEIVHWKQMQTGMEMSGEDGSEAENQANAIAGIIMRRFGERYPDYFINSLP